MNTKDMYVVRNVGLRGYFELEGVGYIYLAQDQAFKTRNKDIASQCKRIKDLHVTKRQALPKESQTDLKELVVEEEAVEDHVAKKEKLLKKEVADESPRTKKVVKKKPFHLTVKEGKEDDASDSE